MALDISGGQYYVVSGMALGYEVVSVPLCRYLAARRVPAVCELIYSR